MNTLHAASGFQTPDPLEQMAREDRDDWVLLRLVVCVAVATLAMAVATTLPV
jgi:hypothetical protein